ncbi:hypothetical protein RHORCCE3_1321 [Rickettsia hoogstraalii str. RCCE3]|nr:hypothetical protein RHORCCE3_1321 [Rickettsia hoogstraalii str. RCCE3]
MILTKFLFGIISKFSASFSSPAKIIIFLNHSSEISSFDNFFSSYSVSSSKERLLGFSLNNLSNLSCVIKSITFSKCQGKI